MARIARRSLRLSELPLFSMKQPWERLVATKRELALQLFEPRYVELARAVEPPAGDGRFGYTAVSERRLGGVGMLVQGSRFRWQGAPLVGPVQLLIRALQRFRVLSLTIKETSDGSAPLYLAKVQLLLDQDCVRVGSRPAVSLRSRLKSSLLRHTRKVNGSDAPTTIFGHTYVQQGAWGFASYHFEEAGSYISYESHLSCTFPDLDNGSRPPQRKDFTAASYDPLTRTFRGEVDWSPTTWKGAEKWSYEMIFSKDFSRIDAGKVMCKPSTNAHHTAVFGRELFYHRWLQPPESPEELVRSILQRVGVAEPAIEETLAQALDSPGKEGSAKGPISPRRRSKGLPVPAAASSDRGVPSRRRCAGAQERRTMSNIAV